MGRITRVELLVIGFDSHYIVEKTILFIKIRLLGEYRNSDSRFYEGNAILSYETLYISLNMKKDSKY